MKIHRAPTHLTPGEGAIIDLLKRYPDQLTVRDVAERLESTPLSIKVMITKLRHKGYRISSPRYRDWNAPRLGVPQTYRLDGEPTKC